MTNRALSFDASTTSVDAVQRAAYRLSDQLSCDVALANGRIEVTLHPSQPETDLNALLGEFRNEVLDQVLRERIRNETGDVRNLVLALAFSKTGLVESDG